jgi:hypothetical protein
MCRGVIKEQFAEAVARANYRDVFTLPDILPPRGSLA